jgi:hypothetical protein
MIPTIEQILADLMDGSITREKALAWIEAHIEAAEDANHTRDFFAGQALQALLPIYESGPTFDLCERAYRTADNMLKARAA